MSERGAALEEAVTAAQRREAERWIGSKVRISSSNSGDIYVPHHHCQEDGDTAGGSKTRNGQVVVTTSYVNSSTFVVEAVPDMPEGVVAFRFVDDDVDDPNKDDDHNNLYYYLTNIMYGDENRQAVATALASIPSILPAHIGKIVDYTVGRPTTAGNFEGAGYNYSPMTVQRGQQPPTNKLQMFCLESTTTNNNNGRQEIGVRSLFGTYWRSEWWNKVVSQSPHLEGDERWTFHRVSATTATAANPAAGLM